MRSIRTMPKLKMEMNDSLTDPSKRSKSGKIKCVSLTKLFTQEQIRLHTVSLGKWFVRYSSANGWSSGFWRLVAYARPAKDFVRGSINNRPFRPGGLDDSQASERALPEGARNGDWVRELIGGGSAQIVPPSFRNGMDLGCLMEYPYHWKSAREKCADDHVERATEENLNKFSVQFDDLFKKAWEEDPGEQAWQEDASKQPGSDGPAVEAESEAINVVREAETSNVIPEAETSFDQILLNESEKIIEKFDGLGDDNKKNEGEAWALVGGTEEIVGI